MPAKRSRTLQWRRGLEQIQERSGSIDVTIGSSNDDAGSHLVWRLTVLGIRDDELLVEEPATLGRAIPVRDGVGIIATITIGQNRWMFESVALGTVDYQVNPRRIVRGVRLKLPESVQRCQRRNYYRMGTAEINLPEIDMWPLLDPKSVVVAERATELIAERAGCVGTIEEPSDDEDLRPELGPQFPATLLNLGGGGLGLCVADDHAGALARHKLFWMRLALPPDLPYEVCATAKLAHTHIQPDHSTYAGLSFDFSWNPGHQRFVVEAIAQYIAARQRTMLEEPVAVTRRRSA